MKKNPLGNVGKLIRLSKSSISTLEKKNVVKILSKEFLGMGQEVQLFENNLIKFFKNKKRKVVAVSSGTAALQLALQSLNLKSNDEVLVPSLTYLSSFQAISANRLKPVACDVNEKTMTIDIDDLKRKINSKTKVIMPVHYAGGAGNLNEVYAIAKKKSLRVVEDAAHAFGTIYNKKLIGSFGDIVCFSFDGIKNITTGEGGCVVSQDKKIIQKIQDSRLLGIHKDSEKRYSKSRSWDFNVTDQGWRYHMSNIMAAIGNIQLKRFKFLSDKRKSLAKKYDKLLINHEQIKIIKHNYSYVVPHIYPVRILGLKDRIGLIKFFKNKNIEVGFHYKPNHLLDFYKKYKVHLPNTEKIFPELLTLPLHPDLRLNDVVKISNILQKNIKQFL
jgi:dTDP-4-amino-4,6-dideoxygalactose transaminase